MISYHRSCYPIIKSQQTMETTKHLNTKYSYLNLFVMLFRMISAHRPCHPIVEPHVKPWYQLNRSIQNIHDNINICFSSSIDEHIQAKAFATSGIFGALVLQSISVRSNNFWFFSLEF